MRTFSLLLVLAFTAIGTMAQPTLQSGDLSFTPGDNWTIYGSSAYQVPQYGAGLTWNFNSLGLGAWVDIVDIVDPSTSVLASYYPDATATDHDPDFSDFFYASSPTEDLYLGVGISAGGQYRVCDDPQTLITYPFNYQDAFMDTYDCFETGGGFDRILTGTTNVSYEGYGTVVMPSGTYTDCVLIRTQMAWTTEVVGIPDISTFTLLTHRFYKPGIPIYLVSFEDQTYFQGGMGGGNSSVRFPGLLTTELGEVASASAVRVYPNPATHQATLVPGTARVDAIRMWDASGRVVREARMRSSEIQVLDLAGMAEGTYTVECLYRGIRVAVLPLAILH